MCKYTVGIYKGLYPPHHGGVYYSYVVLEGSKVISELPSEKYPNHYKVIEAAVAEMEYKKIILRGNNTATIVYDGETYMIGENGNMMRVFLI